MNIAIVFSLPLTTSTCIHTYTYVYVHMYTHTYANTYIFQIFHARQYQT